MLTLSCDKLFSQTQKRVFTRQVQHQNLTRLLLLEHPHTTLKLRRISQNVPLLLSQTPNVPALAVRPVNVGHEPRPRVTKRHPVLVVLRDHVHSLPNLARPLLRDEPIPKRPLGKVLQGVHANEPHDAADLKRLVLARLHVHIS